jgi:hypothetical protein
LLRFFSFIFGCNGARFAQHLLAGIGKAAMMPTGQQGRGKSVFALFHGCFLRVDDFGAGRWKDLGLALFSHPMKLSPAGKIQHLRESGRI